MIITIIGCNYQYRAVVAKFFCINCPFQVTEFLRGSIQVRKYLYNQFCCYVSLVNGNWLQRDWPICESSLYNVDVRICVLPVTLFSEQFEDIAPNGILIIILSSSLLLRDFLYAKSHKNAAVTL